MKKLNKILIITGGILFLLFGLFHMSFWHLFEWETELVKLQLINSNIMQMINIALIVFLLSFGIIMLLYCNEMLTTKLGRAILIASGVFFLVRLAAEFVFPGSSIIFGIILLLCALIYLIPAIMPDKTEEL